VVNEPLLEKAEKRLEKLTDITIKHLQKPNQSASILEKKSAYFLRIDGISDREALERSLLAVGQL